MALVVLAIGALLVRLSSGPLSLDFLTRYVVDALEPKDGSFRVAVGETELVWTDRWYDVDLSVRDVKCTDAAGTTIASLSSLAMELSVRALLRGVIAPSQITLAEPQLALVREPDGDIDFGLGRDATEAGGESVLAKLFSGEPAQGAAPAAQFLRSIVVHEGQLSLLDRQTGFRTQAGSVRIEIQRATDSLDVSLATVVELGSQHIPLQATVARAKEPGGTQAHLSFSDLEPAAATDALHVLELPPGSVANAILDAAADLRLPLAGSIDLDLDADNVVRSVKVDASAAQGTIAVPAPLDQQIAIERIALGGVYDAATDAVDLQYLEVDLDGPELNVSGRWSGQDGGALTLDAKVADLAVDSLARYWPATAAASARRWVTTNITAGSVRGASVALRGTLVPAHPPSFTIDELKGRISYAGLSVRYVDTMPPATGVDGSATFSADGFDFRVASAKVAGLAVPSASVVISGLGAKVKKIAIDAQTRGSIRDALTLVDAPPLHYAKQTGIDPASVSGSVDARVRLAFPLAGAPIPDDLGVVVDAKLRDAGLANAVGDWALSDGDLELDVAADVLSLTGTGKLAGVACDATWHENLASTNAVRRTVDVRSEVNGVGRAALGFDLRPGLTGPTKVMAHIEQRRDGKGSASLGIDLGDATLDVPQLRLVKHPGEPARADLSLILAGNKITGVSPFSFTSPGASAHGKATLGSGKARIATLSVDGILPPAAAGDLSPQFELSLQPAPTGNRFELTSNDTSTLLLLLLPNVQTKGGRLKFTGTIDLEAAGMPFSGDLGIKSFTLTKSPVLARLLMLSSLSGLQSTFEGEGLKFDTLSSGIASAAGAVTFKDGAIDGPSVKLVFSGTVDSRRDDVTMDGTLVPSLYGLNTMAARVPVIGGLFGGSEGVIAIDFTLRGPIADPNISVKPLSSIAPGVLRRLARRLPW
jgi:hypothetical protein